MVLNISIRDFGRDDILTGVRDDRKLHILVSINDRLNHGKGDDQGPLRRMSKPHSTPCGRTTQLLLPADCTNRQEFVRQGQTEPYNVHIRTGAGPGTRDIAEY